jgi:hypothetical protein
VGVIVAPQEFVTVGDAGTTCALTIHATVELPFAGSVNVGGDTVYVYTHGVELPVQSVKVQVYVFVPEQTGSDPTTGPVTESGSPHELSTEGGVGTTCAFTIHGTVEPPFAGKLDVGGVTVYV